jgi:hypothetical protein
MIFFLFLQLAPDTSGRDSSDIVHYQARQIIYDLERSQVTLNDSSVITYRDLILHSDSAYYHVDDKYLEAFGRCRLKETNDSIEGGYLKYNLTTKKAFMSGGRTQIEKGYLDGRRIYWVDKNTVDAYDGKYTTCGHDPPHYYFYSPTMKLFIGDMVITRPIILYIEGVPVMAAPFWFVPVSSKRKSGLLPFRAGNSSAFGKYIRGFAYYMVLGDYADLTLQVDAMEKKGFMPQLEGVWNYSPFSSGTFLTSYIKELDTGLIRYSLQARSSSPYFLLGSSFGCDIDYQSDFNYQSAYADTAPIWLKREAVSQATLTRDLAGIKNSLFFERNQNFADTTLLERLPNYSASTPSLALFSLINYSFTGHYNRYRFAGPRDTVRTSWANLHTAPSLQQNILGLATVSPQIDADLALYEKDSLGNPWPVRFGYSFGVAASTNLYRIYGLEALGVHGLLHKVTPRVSYAFTPDFDFTRFPSRYGPPAYSRRSQLGFGVGQDFEVKLGEDRQKMNLLRIDLGSGYNLLSDSLSPVTFTVSLPVNPFPKPVAGFNAQVSGVCDLYTRIYTYEVTNSFTIQAPGFSLNFNQSYVKDGKYQFWLSGQVRPTRNWNVGYSARYDWETRRLVDYGLSLTRDLHCWEGVFSFNQLGNDWRYDFKVRIKDIPEIAIGKGLLGSLFE